MLLALESVVTKAQPQSVWQVWEKVAEWKEWDEGVEWSRLEGPFQVGSKGRLKPKGGPETVFELVEVSPLRRFVDRTRLPLATLWFTHEVELVGEGSRITVRVDFEGFLGRFFALVIGGGIKSGLPAALRSLAVQAEAKEAG